MRSILFVALLLGACDGVNMLPTANDSGRDIYRVAWCDFERRCVGFDDDTYSWCLSDDAWADYSRTWSTEHAVACADALEGAVCNSIPAACQ